jgi:hypothetical protein
MADANGAIPQRGDLRYPRKVAKEIGGARQ